MAVSSDNSVCYTNLLFPTFLFPQVIVEVIEEKKSQVFREVLTVLIKSRVLHRKAL